MKKRIKSVLMTFLFCLSSLSFSSENNSQKKSCLKKIITSCKNIARDSIRGATVGGLVGASWCLKVSYEKEETMTEGFFHTLQGMAIGSGSLAIAVSAYSFVKSFSEHIGLGLNLPDPLAVVSRYTPAGLVVNFSRGNEKNH